MPDSKIWYSAKKNKSQEAERIITMVAVQNMNNNKPRLSNDQRKEIASILRENIVKNGGGTKATRGTVT